MLSHEAETQTALENFNRHAWTLFFDWILSLDSISSMQSFESVYSKDDDSVSKTTGALIRAVVCQRACMYRTAMYTEMMAIDQDLINLLN